ncbi:hypothetical protein BJ944DRAFT_263443 [Cunninghamella echinulata]|nr:hypothetical protein BJ944DRAFT_263443 [Cunninghamella echinulata]
MLLLLLSLLLLLLLELLLLFIDKVKLEAFSRLVIELDLCRLISRLFLLYTGIDDRGDDGNCEEEFANVRDFD